MFSITWDIKRLSIEFSCNELTTTDTLRLMIFLYYLPCKLAFENIQAFKNILILPGLLGLL